MLSKFESVGWALHYTWILKSSYQSQVVLGIRLLFTLQKFLIYTLYPACRILALIIHTAAHKSISIYKAMCYSSISIYNNNTWAIKPRPLKKLGIHQIQVVVSHHVAPPPVFYFFFNFQSSSVEMLAASDPGTHWKIHPMTFSVNFHSISASL